MELTAFILVNFNLNGAINLLILQSSVCVFLFCVRIQKTLFSFYSRKNSLILNFEVIIGRKK